MYKRQVFQLTSEFLEEPTEPITPTVVFDPSSVVILPRGANSASVDMVIYAANPITTTSYLSALTVKAEEQTGVGVRRWGSANFRYGDPGADFTLYAAEGQVNVPQDGTVDIYLTTTSFGGLDENKVPVTASIVAPAGTVWGTVFTSGQSDEIKRIRGVSQDRFTLKVRADAPASEPGIPYTVRFTIGPAAGRYHTVDVVVNVHTCLLYTSPSPRD